MTLSKPYAYPIDDRTIQALAERRGVKPSRVREELRRLHSRDEQSRNCRTSAKYSWTWVSRRLVPLLYELIPADGISLEAFYWILRCREQPKYTRWITMSDVSQMATKRRCPRRDDKLFPPEIDESVPVL